MFAPNHSFFFVFKIPILMRCKSMILQRGINHPLLNPDQEQFTTEHKRMYMKNYVVKIKAIKNSLSGLIKYTRYLVNKLTKSHAKTKISVLFNKPNSYMAYAKTNAERAEIKNLFARKGGRPISNYGRSLTLNFPKTIQPTREEAADITELLLDDILRFINVPPKEPLRRKNQTIDQYQKNIKAYKRELDKHKILDKLEFRKSILAVFHDQDNSHIHLNLASFIESNNIRAYKRKSFVTFVKSSFTRHTDKIMDMSIKDYVVEMQTSYSKKEILNKSNSIKETVKSLEDVVSALRQAYPQESNYFNKILKDLEKGHTNKAKIKIDKVKKKYQHPTL